jgi:hypothetical protein
MSTEGVEAEDFEDDRRRESAAADAWDEVAGEVRGRVVVNASGETSTV